MSWYSGSQLTMRSARVRPSTWLKSAACRRRSAAEKRLAVRWPVVPAGLCRLALARSQSASASPVASTAWEIDVSQYRRVCLRVGYCITSGWAPASTQPSQASTSSGPDG